MQKSSRLFLYFQEDISEKPVVSAEQIGCGEVGAPLHEDPSSPDAFYEIKVIYTKFQVENTEYIYSLN